MKPVVIILGVLLVAGGVFFFLMAGDEQVPAEPVVKEIAAKPEPKPVVEPTPVPPPPTELRPTMNSEERAVVLAAIAHAVAQANNRVEDASASYLPGPMTPEQRREDKKFTRDSFVRLMPVVRDCLNAAVKEQPNLGTSGYQARFTVQGAKQYGSAVTNIEIFGKEGPVAAPALQKCLQETSTGMRFAEPPDTGRDPTEARDFTFPLRAAGGVQ